MCVTCEFREDLFDRHPSRVRVCVCSVGSDQVVRQVDGSLNPCRTCLLQNKSNRDLDKSFVEDFVVYSSTKWSKHFVFVSVLTLGPFCTFFFFLCVCVNEIQPKNYSRTKVVLILFRLHSGSTVLLLLDKRL